MRGTWALVTGLAMCAGIAGQARGDNWLQTGHDAQHTLASKDPVKLPLTDIWSVPYGLPCSVAQGRAYFVVAPRLSAGVSTLVCVSARTGTVLWSQPLNCSVNKAYLHYDDFSPSISADGAVYVADSRVATRGLVPGFRIFHGLTGQLIGGYFPSDVERPPTRVIVEDYPQAQERTFVERPLEFTGWPLNFAPELLLGGNGLFATLRPRQFLNWAPQLPAQYGVLTHLDHKLAASGRVTLTYGEPYQAHVATTAGTLVSGSWVVGGPQFFEPSFLTLLEGGGARWHLDFPWHLSQPCADSSSIYVLMSGSGGTHTVAALSPSDSRPRWRYPDRWPLPLTGSGHSVELGSTARLMHINRQLVLADGTLFAYAEAFGLTALDTQNGRPLWTVKPGAIPLGASRDHLFVYTSHAQAGTRQSVSQLVALRKSDGKPEWVQETPGRGFPNAFHRVAISDGQLFAQTSDALTAFAPAERTFRLAIDSSRKELYQPDSDPAKPVVPTDYIAEATVVRVPWNEPLAESNRRLTERRKIAPGLPLLLELEWLDPQRAAVLGAPAGKPDELPARAAFLARCRALAAEYQPEHLDLAPEVNVYLARHPEQLDAVRDLLTAAAKEVHAVSSKTLVLLSLNGEVLYGLYGKGSTAPFGKLELAGRQDVAPLKTLLATVDELGLASCPQAAFPRPVDVPRDYFLAVKQALEAKRLIVSGLRVELRENTPAGQVEQASFLKHLTQNCYWLDAALVACPDLPLSPPPAPEPSNKAAARPILPSVPVVGALDIWRDVLRWERVERLTLSANLPAAPAGPAPAQ